MNKTRRVELSEIRSQLLVSQDKLSQISMQEQDSFDNLTEGLQATMRGAAMEEAIENMNLAIEAIDEAISYIDEASV